MKEVCGVLSPSREGDLREGKEGEGGEKVHVKASGGIRTLADFQRMVRAGAGRVGCSAGVAIVGEVGREKEVSGGGGGRGEGWQW